MKVPSLLLKNLLLLAVFSLIVACNAGSEAETEGAEETTEASAANGDFQISLAQWSLHKSFFGDVFSNGWGWFGKMLQESQLKWLALD